MKPISKKSASELDAEELAYLQKLKARFDDDTADLGKWTTSLSSKEFAQIGKFIQTFCYADFCARRILDCISEATAGEASRTAGSLRDHDVFDKLEAAAERLTIENHRLALLAAARAFAMHRDMRHRLAHWVVRRVKREQALMLLGKDYRRASKEGIGQLDSRTGGYGLFGLRTFRRELKKLEDHAQTLSLMAPAFENFQEDLITRVR